MTENKESSSSSSWLPWRRSSNNKNTDNKNIDENNKKTEATTPTTPTTTTTTTTTTPTPTPTTTATTTTTTTTTTNKNIENEQIKSKNKEEGKNHQKNQDKQQQPRTKEEEERKTVKRLEKKNRFLLQEEKNRMMEEKKERMVDLLENPPILKADLTTDDKMKLVYNRYGYTVTPKQMLWRAGFTGGIAGALIGNSIAKSNPIKPIKTFTICLFAGIGGYIGSSFVYSSPNFKENYDDYIYRQYDIDTEDYFFNEVPDLLIRRELLKKNIKTDIHGRILKE
ncbi:hypothetical protein ACTFIY_010653 [Dictyostelium cf. discoideum]